MERCTEQTAVASQRHLRIAPRLRVAARQREPCLNRELRVAVRPAAQPAARRREAGVVPLLENATLARSARNDVSSSISSSSAHDAA